MNNFCTNCGNPIPANATTCPACGHPVAPVTTNEPVTPEPVSAPLEEPKSKKGMIALVVGIIVVGVVGGYFGWNVYSERQLWSEISQSTEVADYENYLDRFPNGAHHTLAMARYEDLKKTRDKWLAIEMEDDFDLYRNFVRENPESAYRELAVQRMDSIAWSDALRADNPAGYRLYLDRMPKGTHVEEAATKAENMEMRTLSPMEEEGVTEIISSFFSAVEYENIDEAIALFPAEFSFMGREANKVHVINYVRSLHGDNVSTVSVTPSNFVVKKDVDENRAQTYAVTFNLDVRTVYKDDTPDAFVSYTGAAVIDANDMITSLALRRVATT